MDPFRPLFARLAPWLSGPGWPQWRAALLLFHVVAITLVAFPAPLRKLDDATWQKPAVRIELANWTQRVNSVGIDASEDDVRAFATTWSERWLGARNTVVAPFKAYLKALGTPQNWYMFTGADRAPQRFALAFTDERGTLEPVFELGVAVHLSDLLEPAFLDEHRVRRALLQTAWSQNPQTFDDVCRYFDRTLRSKRSPVAEVRCQLLVQTVEHPSARDLPRPVTVGRTLVVRPDGTTSDHLKKKRKKGRKP